MSTTCDAIMSCIAANLGLGLDYDEVTRQIDLRISSDAGNSAGLGTDDGLYAGTATGPDAMTWPKTVDTLPAQAISANGGGTLVGASTSPQLIEYAIANDLDIYTVGTYLLADGVPYEQIGSLTQAVNVYTDNPAAIANRYLSSLTVQQLNYDAGTRQSPTGANTGASSQFLTPYGGWGGFYAPQYKARTISEMLRQIRGRIVVGLHPQRLGLTPEQIEAEIRAVVDAVVDAGAQEWVIIYISGVLDDNTRSPLATWVPIVTAAGITAGVTLTAEHEQVGSVWTPAEIVATGATWVEVRGGSDPNPATDARITALVGAGLEVQVSLDGRQYWVDYSFDLGARSVRVPDGVYARGATTHPRALTYRRTLIPGLSTRTPDIGVMTPKTDDEQALFNAGFARVDQPGRWFPANYAWTGTTARIRNHQLLGTICPIPNTTNYRIRLRVRRENATPLGGSLAVVVASPTDREYSWIAPASNNTIANGYLAELRTFTGSTNAFSMRLYRVLNGIQTAIASVVNGAWLRVGEWALISVTVTPTQVSFSATDSVTTTTATASDTTHRGAYAFYQWSDQGAPFVHGYDNPTDLMTYEALS
jgi:hypothetical protein